jgi:hypothetical protein
VNEEAMAHWGGAVAPKTNKQTNKQTNINDVYEGLEEGTV